MVKNTAARNVTRSQSKIAHVVRNRPDDGVLADDSREVEDSDAEDHIRRLVDEAPPLSASQRDRLALLLRDPSARMKAPGRSPRIAGWLDTTATLNT